MRRSAVVTFVVITPAVATVVLLAHPILMVFGPQYAAGGRDTLVVLALSAFAVAFNTWSSFLLKITRQLLALTLSNVVYAGGTVLLVVLGVAHGPVWVAAAWGVGNLLSGVAATLALVTHRRTSQPHPEAPVPPWVDRDEVGSSA
jgi:O-antigen/teichoic acid export membrane protein